MIHPSIQRVYYNSPCVMVPCIFATTSAWFHSSPPRVWFCCGLVWLGLVPITEERRGSVLHGRSNPGSSVNPFLLFIPAFCNVDFIFGPYLLPVLASHLVATNSSVCLGHRSSLIVWHKLGKERGSHSIYCISLKFFTLC